MKTPTAVEAYLHEHIPLAAAMGVRVIAATVHEVILEAPLEPNLNHRDTASGAVSPRCRSSPAGRSSTAACTRRELAPVDTAFRATCQSPPPTAWARFLRTLARKGRARVWVEAEVTSRGTLAARFEGAYVALGPPQEPV